ncbi:MAG TPA: hypothetical protein VK840_01255 [Candidatus Dormibacteraeota bacterium]|jgi:hypothetical protein|nr:hypothetical protein [Candidatus Dormibacteraeota bacterium]
MMAFWNSVDKATKEGFKMAWFGVVVAILGRFLPEYGWLFWFGIGTTAIGIVLRQRGENLKKLEAAPRKITVAKKENLLHGLKSVPKSPVKVHFIGHDAEPKQFAAQLKQLLGEAGFHVEAFSGALAFEPLKGLFITVCEWDSQNPTALGIQKAFVSAGLAMEFHALFKQKESSIEICVYGKPSKNQSTSK